ncbi:hypothetical protein QE152_g1668 [Popillia japonica]|uniref:Uncharacterized protein n=1 Tax=Popillia japonica TaxID=7064 RepID=A0AAW1N6B3_POPJA
MRYGRGPAVSSPLEGEDMNTLQEYIVNMEKRSAIDNTSVPEDVWAQLQQKDNDLVLAAELGKALLKRQHEAKEEYFRKMKK